MNKTAGMKIKNETAVFNHALHDYSITYHYKATTPYCYATPPNTKVIQEGAANPLTGI